MDFLRQVRGDEVLGIKRALLDLANLHTPEANDAIVQLLVDRVNLVGHEADWAEALEITQDPRIAAVLERLFRDAAVNGPFSISGSATLWRVLFSKSGVDESKTVQRVLTVWGLGTASSARSAVMQAIRKEAASAELSELLVDALTRPEEAPQAFGALVRLGDDASVAGAFEYLERGGMQAAFSAPEFGPELSDGAASRLAAAGERDPAVIPVFLGSLERADPSVLRNHAGEARRLFQLAMEATRDATDMPSIQVRKQAALAMAKIAGAVATLELGLFVEHEVGRSEVARKYLQQLLTRLRDSNPAVDR